MQSEPVKNVSLAGLVGFGRQADSAKAIDNKPNGAFTAELKRLAEAEAVAELGRSVVSAAATVATGSAALAVEVAAKTEQDAKGIVNIEELMRLARLAAPAENDGDGTESGEAPADIAQEEKLRLGNELISYALKQLAAILGLPDEEGDAPPAFEFNAESIEQLAAIMAYLDLTIKMANDRIDVSANAESANMAMAAYGMESPIADIAPEENPAELSDFAAALRTEKFRMEMAFNLIGVGGIIAEKMSEKSDSGEATGIPQAVNPANLGMSVADTVSAFSNLIKEELAASADRVRQIARGQAELTGLERAAIELGTVKSEILKAALGKSNPAAAINDKFAGVNLAVNARAETGTGVAGQDRNDGLTANVKADVNTGNNKNVNTDAGTDTDTVEVRANVKTEAKSDVNTANVKADVNTGNNKQAAAAVTIDTDAPHVDTGNNKNVNTEAKSDVKTDVKTEVKASVNTADVKTEAKPDVNTWNSKQAAAAVTIDTDAPHVDTGNNKNVNTEAKADVKTEAKSDVNTANVKPDVNTANVKADVNTWNSKQAAAEVTIDTDAPHVGTGNNKNVNTEAGTDTGTAYVKADVFAGNNKEIAGQARNDALWANVKADVKTEAAANVNTPHVKAEVKVESEPAVVKAGIKAEAAVDTHTAKAGPVVYAKVNDGINAGAEAGAEDKLPVAARGKRAVETADVPLSARESAGRRLSSVESANRQASKSAEPAMGAKPNSAGESAAVPVSVMALARGKKAAKAADAVPAEHRAPAHAQAKAPAKNADGKAAELPVSVTEAKEIKEAAKKPLAGHIAGSVSGAKAAAKEAAKAVAAAAAEGAKSGSAPNAADNEVFAAKLKQASELSGFVKNIGGKPAGKPTDGPAAQAKSASPASNAAPANSAVNNAVNNIESDTDIDKQADGGDDSAKGGGSVNPTESKSAAAARHSEKADAAALSQNERLEVIRQISERLNNAVRTGANEIRLTLRPEALGEVRMSLRVQGDVVFAKMQVESKQVKALVESNMQSLKDSLSRQNLEFGAIDVEVGADSEGGRSTREMWQEMAERSEPRGFREGTEAATAVASDGFIDTPLGSETGRRFGDNTFEYFA
jgi:flagellar hook-length control protein FliK